MFIGANDIQTPGMIGTSDITLGDRVNKIETRLDQQRMMIFALAALLLMSKLK